MKQGAHRAKEVRVGGIDAPFLPLGGPAPRGPHTRKRVGGKGFRAFSADVEHFFPPGERLPAATSADG